METIDGIKGDGVSLFHVNKNPSRVDLRKFGRAMLGGFTVLGVILWLAPVIAAWWNDRPASWDMLHWSSGRNQWASIVCWVLGPLLFASSLAPYPVARTVYVGWMSVVVPIGIFVSTIVMTLVFLLVLPVFSLIRFNDPLHKKLHKKGTYWEDAKPYEPTIERMMRPF
jgi:amino acid transporter